MDPPVFHPAFQRQRQAVQLFHLLLRRDPHSHWPRRQHHRPLDDFGGPHWLWKPPYYIYTYNIYICIYTEYEYTYIYMIQRVITIIVSLIIIIELINYRFTSHLRLVSNDFEGLVIARSHFLSYQPTILFHPCSLAVGCRNPYLTVDFIPIFCWSKTINTNSCGLNPCFFPS